MRTKFIKIRKGERLSVCLFLLWQLIMHATVIIPYYSAFSRILKDYRKNTLDWFHVSGFDPFTYCVVIDWIAAYDVHRHPLLVFSYCSVYFINQELTSLLGINCVQFLAAIVLLVSSPYAFLLMIRVGRKLPRLSQREPPVLAFLFFLFAYVLLAAISPDHSTLSLFLILLVTYVIGRQMAEYKPLKKWQTTVFSILTVGVSLNNGLKVLSADSFLKEKRLLHPKNLILVVILSSAAIWSLGLWEYKTFVADSVNMRKKYEKRVVKDEKTKMWKEPSDAMLLKGNKQQREVFVLLQKKHRKVQLKIKYSAPQYAHSGTSVSKQPLLNWTDMTTSRYETLAENLLGESIQLYQKYTLCDVTRNRPVFASYNWVVNYIVEGLVVLLFSGGIWVGRRSKLMWVCLLFFVPDMILHIGLGLGINEIYIMTAHWAYVIPLCIGCLVKPMKGGIGNAITLLTALIAFFLIVYNSALVIFTL